MDPKQVAFLALVDAAGAAVRYDDSIAGRVIRDGVGFNAEGVAFAEGEELDRLYADWITKSRSALELARKVGIDYVEVPSGQKADEGRA